MNGFGPAIPVTPPTKGIEPVGITGTVLAPTNPSGKFVIKPPKPTAVPKQSALDKWLAGDTTYKQQLAEFNAEQSAYQANKNRQDQVTNKDFNSTQRQMNTQASTDRNNQQYDFAGRGILHSGVFAKALGDYNTDFQTKLNNLIQGKTDTLTQSQSDLSDFLRSLSLQKNSAKQDAIRRRQAELGI